MFYSNNITYNRIIFTPIYYYVIELFYYKVKYKELSIEQKVFCSEVILFLYFLCKL